MELEQLHFSFNHSKMNSGKPIITAIFRLERRQPVAMEILSPPQLRLFQNLSLW